MKQKHYLSIAETGSSFRYQRNYLQKLTERRGRLLGIDVQYEDQEHNLTFGRLI